MIQAACAFWAAFAVLALIVKAGWTVSLDTRFILGLRALLPGLESPMQIASLLAGDVAAPAAVLIALAIGRRAGQRQGWMYAFACLGGWAVNLTLKAVIQNVRPQDISPKLTSAGWFSFPSGHAMLGMLIFGFGAYLLAATLEGRASRVAVIVAGVVVALAIGMSRVYLGAHWPSDVFAAYLAACGWAAVCLILRDRAARRAAGVPTGEPA